MANMVTRIFNAVADQVVRWICANVFCASIVARSMRVRYWRGSSALGWPCSQLVLCQWWGSNSSMRLLSCVGSLVSTSLR